MLNNISGLTMLWLNWFHNMKYKYDWLKINLPVIYLDVTFMRVFVQYLGRLGHMSEKWEYLSSPVKILTDTMDFLKLYFKMSILI